MEMHADVCAVQIYNDSVLDLLAMKRRPSYSNSNYPEYANRIDSGNKTVQISTNEKVGKRPWAVRPCLVL